MKQDHIADLLGVSQGLVSRWEAGLHTPSPALYRRLERLLVSEANQAADTALRRLIENAVAPVHLICDASHVLLAASPAREAEWGSRAMPFIGASLWRFATAEIVANEEQLPDHGWFEELILGGWLSRPEGMEAAICGSCRARWDGSVLPWLTDASVDL